MKPLRLFGIANSSGEKEKVENLLSNMKEMKDIKNECVIFTGLTKGK